MRGAAVERLLQLTSPTSLAGATPEPTPVETLDPLTVTPGVLGFLVIFAVVLACIPLFLSMTGKLRKVEHSARREQAEAAAGGGSGPQGPGRDHPVADGPAADRPVADGAPAEDTRSE